MPIHIAITRRVRAGREAEFQQALREFFRESFSHAGVLGVTMLAPLPNSPSQEYGIIRTFENEAERDAFYASSIFRNWLKRVEPLTEGEPEYRQLHGLEAWFRSTASPPRWKMALVTFVGVYAVSTIVDLIIGPLFHAWPFFLSNAVFNIIGVILLTWVVMPLLTKILRNWLSPRKRKDLYEL